MKLPEKQQIALTQMIVVLMYFGAIALNYFCLFPIIRNGEGARISAIVDTYCRRFLPFNGCDVRDKAQRDSVMAATEAPYGTETLWIIDTRENRVIFPEGISGDAYAAVSETYGPVAAQQFKHELSSESDNSSIDFDVRRYDSMYATYYEKFDLMFFYVINYMVSGSAQMHIFYMMLLALAIGGLLIIIFGYRIVYRMNDKIRQDSMVQRDLDTASDIQKAMMPRGKKHLLQIDVDARLEPARKIGGDFYCYLVQNGLIYFCIGDVSGKGIPASIFMSKAVTLFRSFANTALSPAAIASRMNAELCVNNGSNMFMTGILGTMSTSDGKVTFINAGHEPPVVCSGEPGAKPEYLSSNGNIPFGVFEDTEYVEEQFELSNNGLMLLYTDGVSEARSKEGKLMGRERLLNFLDQCKTSTSGEINDKLLTYISDYESGTDQSDDITLLTFRNVATPKSLTIKNEIKDLRKLPAFTDEIFKECSMDGKVRMKTRVGLDEALTNCVLYAYDAPGNDINVTASMDNHCLCFTIKDSGRPFNPLEYVPESSDELSIGGRGISIFRESFDDVQYVREDGYNILKLIKKLYHAD